MYIYIRLFKTLWNARHKPAAPQLQRDLHFRIWPNDLDFNLHMNNGRYLTLMDLGRIDLMVRGGLTLKRLRALRWAPVLGNCTIRFRRPLNPFQRYTLRTRLEAWDDKWLYMTHSFILPDGKVAALALVRGCFTSPQGTVTPAQIMQEMAYTLPSPELPAAYRQWSEVDEQLWKMAEAR